MGGQSSSTNQLSVNNQNQRQPISVGEKIGRNEGIERNERDERGESNGKIERKKYKGL